MQEERKREREFRTTVDGTVIKRVYSPAELAKFKQDNGLPGEYPFTRYNVGWLQEQVGEITDALGDMFGEYRAPSIL